MEKADFFSYAGFHFKLCSLELRELFTHIFESPTFADTVRKYVGGVQEFVPLYTCNRFDICFFGKVSKNDISELFWQMTLSVLDTRLNHFTISQNELKKHILNSLRFAADEEGLRLFLKVASSLDSLVLGETQILGQLKSSYLLAKKNGFVEKTAVEIFDHCFRVSKRIRNETELFKNVISIGHLAVEFARKEFVNFFEKNIVIFGAGEMALLTAKHFSDHGAKNLFIANRTFANAQWVCQKINKGTPLELSCALNHITQFDICVVACGGDSLLITPQYFENYTQKRVGQPSLFIDISVPRKIDNSLAEIPQLKLFNIDHLSSIVEQNKESRKGALQNAENIIDEEINIFLTKRKKKEDTRHIRNFNAWLNTVVQKEVDRYLNQKSNSKKITASSIVARSVCKKVSAKMRGKTEF